MAAVRPFKPNPSSEATLKCSRIVNRAVSGANTQSSYPFRIHRKRPHSDDWPHGSTFLHSAQRGLGAAGAFLSLTPDAHPLTARALLPPRPEKRSPPGPV